MSEKQAKEPYGGSALSELTNIPDVPSTDGKKPEEEKFDLGLDEEVVIKKERKPRIKLDEDYLLSENGIPRLRKTAPSLRFKGKNHEAQDMKRLLAFYQLWAHEMFPKAKFDDTIIGLQSLGKRRMMKIHRRHWIEEYSNPHRDEDLFADLLEDEAQHKSKDATGSKQSEYVQTADDENFVVRDPDDELMG
ncbi:replication fork protection complex subunit Swi3 [Schizosaccharomyces japonicus yFS275]|uniref:Chromosome segregation in meiosis protein n=1 Tax=Schizosaccharomyces japonicus (strain yFS275 / FY16936) TaxID=402676 RepID=B6K3B3_SCHJY|nr:replication fork protection complex subunit Swi3 [Schizosaccharomyces japonicus yFS275]EEB07970.2 replication fork protection complex subunit Swi3 [Schizosaccharomyces japonicus yFS275]